MSISGGLTRFIEQRMHDTRKGTSRITLWPSALLSAKKAHTSAEDLILSAVIDMCTEILGE